GRKPAVGWIHNQRRAPGSDHRVSAVVPELVVGSNAAGWVLQPSLLWIDEITILASIFFPFKGCRFVIRQKLFPGERARPFQRSNGAVIPHALQIRMAPRCPGGCPRF